MDRLDALFIRAPRQYTDGVTGIIFPWEALYPTILEYNGYSARFLNPEIVERRFQPGLYTKKTFYVSHRKLLQDFIKNEDHPRWRFLSLYVKKFNPSIIFLTHLFPSDFSVTVRTAEIIKKLNPNIFVVSINVNRKEAEVYIKSSSYIDFCIFGEPEYTLLEIMRYLKNGKLRETVKKIRGIVFKKESEVKSTEERELERNLDNFPIPNRDLVIKKEWYPPSGFGVVEISRGCVYSCNFCTLGPPLRFRSPESVIKEIMYIIKKYKTREFVLDASSVLHNISWMERFCTLIKEKKLKFSWSGFVNVNQINERIIRIMRSCGLCYVTFGIESGSIDTLKNFNKLSNINILNNEENVKEKVEILKRNGILWRTGIIAGSPSETPEDLIKNIKILRLLRPDFFRFQFLVPKVGTIWYEKLVENKKNSLDNFHTGHLFFKRKNKKLYYRLWNKMEKLSMISEKNFLIKKFLKPRVFFLKLIEYLFYMKNFIYK